MVTVSQRTPTYRRSRHPRSGARSHGVYLGLYRTTIEGIGECACLHPDAGDCAPYLPREIYEALAFTPDFSALPAQADYERRHPPGSVRTPPDQRTQTKP